ncbi:MAG: DNA-3-methyladenine glycosylase [Candidatus Liptonbacteria bacterium]|nr:DNA-3-methyladenine glycosylase [Candidatus Liptonbacteria bacterium]
MSKILPRQFFKRSTRVVAKDLLGKFLVRRFRSKTQAYMITEVEAYDGFRDRASHASRGKTKRNAPMFGPPGHWYVYFTYGMHWMLNIVTRERGYPAAVLIRSVVKIKRNGEPRRRRAASFVSNLEHISGPGRLAKRLHINKRLNGLPASRRTGLWIIEDRGVRISRAKIKKTPRVGVAYAGSEWAAKPRRFLIARDL